MVHINEGEDVNNELHAEGGTCVDKCTRCKAVTNVTQFEGDDYCDACLTRLFEDDEIAE